MSNFFTAELQVDYGTDIAMVPARARLTANAGDLPVTGIGDLTYTDGPALVMQARIRELMTPYGYYGRYVADLQGVKYIDGDYGNPAFFVLSEPTNSIPMEFVSASCEYVMLKDPRVQVATARPDIDPDTNTLLIQIDFMLVTGASGSFRLALRPQV